MLLIVKINQIIKKEKLLLSLLLLVMHYSYSHYNTDSHM